METQMLTGKQKRYLRSKANTLITGIHIGKEGINQSFIIQLKEILDKKELIKVSVLQSSPASAKEAALKTARITEAEVVQTIGRKFILYRRAEENPVIVLPE